MFSERMLGGLVRNAAACKQLPNIIGAVQGHSSGRCIQHSRNSLGEDERQHITAFSPSYIASSLYASIEAAATCGLLVIQL
jgi:hypothetical protein